MIYVLYHAQCTDGFCAAYIASKKLGFFNVEYIPVSHSEPCPELEDGSEVYIIDFAYDRETLLSLNSRMKKLEVLDHHKTARDDLAGLDFCTFDMDRSGARLSYDRFFPNNEEPVLGLLASYVQDVDLWQHKMPNTREICQIIYSTRKEFDWYEVLFIKMKLNLPALIEEGRSQLGVVDNITRTIELSTFDIDFKDPRDGMVYKVPVINGDLFVSQACNHIIEWRTDAKFCAAFNFKGPNQVKWSLRSRGDFDVAELAKAFGGGGHRAAAGFNQSLSSFTLLLGGW